MGDAKPRRPGRGSPSRYFGSQPIWSSADPLSKVAEKLPVCPFPRQISYLSTRGGLGGSRRCRIQVQAAITK